MKKINFVYTAALLLPTILVAPGRAQRTEIPVLTQYVGHTSSYFARSEDGSIVTTAADAKKGYRDYEWSNVLVAVEGLRSNRKMRSKTEIWTDEAGRPHSLSVLKRQIDYNDALRAKSYVIGAPAAKIDGLVPESGVLDKASLAIPWAKLQLRADAVPKNLRYERSKGAALSAIDPVAARDKEQFASFVSEKLNEAASKLGSLRTALDTVPLTQPRYMPAPSGSKNVMDGLGGLDFAWAGLSSMSLGADGNVHYRSGDYDVPELSVKEFVDPAGMTTAVVADLLEKEADAAKAVGEAECLFRDLFTPL